MPRSQTPSDQQQNAGHAATAVVDAAGGQLSTQGARLVIPAGALESPTTLTVDRVPDAPECEPQFNFGPEGLQFSSDVRLEIEIPAACSERPSYELFHARTGWRDMLDTRRAGRTLSAPIRHFSTFGAMIVENRPTWGNGNTISQNGVIATLAQGGPYQLMLEVRPERVVLVALSATGVNSRIDWQGLPDGEQIFWSNIGTSQRGSVVPALGAASLNANGVAGVSVSLRTVAGTIRVDSEGDCVMKLHGTWPMGTNTCEMTTDVTDNVELGDHLPNPFVLDCKGHAISVARGTALSVAYRSVGGGTTIKNCRVRSPEAGLLCLDGKCNVEDVNAEAAIGITVAQPNDNQEDEGTGFVLRSEVTASCRGIAVFGRGRFAVQVDDNRVSSANGISTFVQDAQALYRIRNNRIALLPTSTLSPGLVGQVCPGDAGVGISAGLSNPAVLGGILATGNTVQAAGDSEAALKLDFPSALSGHVFVQHNNFVGFPNARVRTHNLVDAQLSVAMSGNYWGYDALPLTRSGDVVATFDANPPPAHNIVDSFPYCYANAWLSPGIAPNACAIPTPHRPDVLDPTAGAVVFAPVSHIRGTSDGTVVELWLGNVLVASDDVVAGGFDIQLPEPATSGSFTAFAYSINRIGAAQAVSEPSAVTFTVQDPPTQNTVVSLPDNGATVVGPAVVLTGVGAPGSAVTVSGDGVPTEPAVVAPNGVWVGATLPMPPGTHAVRVKDAKGTQTLDVTVTASPPAASGDGTISVVRGEVDRHIIKLAEHQVETTRISATVEVPELCDGCRQPGLIDGDGDGVCDRFDNCAAINNGGQVDSDSDGVGDACDQCPADSSNDPDGNGSCNGSRTCADGSEAACGRCLTVTLRARKTYAPSEFFPADACLCRPLSFRIPERVPVVTGNAGNQWMDLVFSLGDSGDSTRCRYRGGSAEAHPDDDVEFRKGLFYVFLWCDNAQAAGEIAQADTLRVELANGDSQSGPTEVMLSLEEESATCSCNQGAAQVQPYTIAREDYRRSLTGDAFRSIATAVPINGTGIATVTHEHRFDGWNSDRIAPATPAMLDRFVSGEVGYVTYAAAAPCPLVDQLDPTGPFAGSSFAQGSGARFCALSGTGSAPSGNVAIDTTFDPHADASLCKQEFEGRINFALGNVSRALPDFQFCCDPIRAEDATWTVTATDSTGQQIVQTSDKQDCKPSEEEAYPLCDRLRPASPAGRFCVELVETRLEVIGRAFVPTVGLCRLTGLDLVPPGAPGSDFPVTSLLDNGPITIAVRGTSAEGSNTGQAGYTGNLGTFTTNVDSDADGFRNRFDLCPSVGESFEQSVCGPTGVSCYARHSPDGDRNCKGDACDVGQECLVEADCPRDPCTQFVQCNFEGRCIYSPVTPPSAFCDDGGALWTWSCRSDAGLPAWDCTSQPPPDTGSPCTIARCAHGESAYVETKAEDGVPCPGGVVAATCDSDGEIVQRPACRAGRCVVDQSGADLQNCAAEAPACQSGECVAVGGEPQCVFTATPGVACDACGGGTCPPCIVGGQCGANGICQPVPRTCPTGTTCNQATGVCQ